MTCNGLEYRVHADSSQLLVALALNEGGGACSCLSPLTSHSNSGLDIIAFFAASHGDMVLPYVGIAVRGREGGLVFIFKWQDNRNCILATGIWGAEMLFLRQDIV